MPAPYAILSDQHLHNWSAFSTTNADGVNSRLRIILDDMIRATDELQAAGGDAMIFAGDLFHVRGSVDPTVLNPAFDVIETILGRGVKIFAIPGNHDLKTKETTELGSAIQSLGKLSGFEVINEPCLRNVGDRLVAFMPWIATNDEVRRIGYALAESIENSESTDLIMHAGINGVLLGVPDHGLEASEIADWGFRRVFAGHYHNHKDFAGGVYSIGATSHQTWSDIGTKAGFLLVDDFVKFRASHAPKFVEITGDTPPEEVPLIVDGNYVRVRLETVTPAQEKTLRDDLTGMGARGIVIQASRAPTVTRTAATVKTGASLEASVGEYVKNMGHAAETKVSALCADILSRARAAATAE